MSLLFPMLIYNIKRNNLFVFFNIVYKRQKENEGKCILGNMSIDLPNLHEQSSCLTKTHIDFIGPSDLGYQC